MERKKAEEKFRLGIEAAPSGMIMFDRQGTIALAKRLSTISTPLSLKFGHSIPTSQNPRATSQRRPLYPFKRSPWSCTGRAIQNQSD